MTRAISDLVTSLGDFPLDPISGKAWLWTGRGETLLWISDAASKDLGASHGDDATLSVAPNAFRSFASLLELASPDQEPVRVQQLTLSHDARSETYTCLCRHVPLSSGAYGLLAVAIGAPARSLSLMQSGGISRLAQRQPERQTDIPEPAPSHVTRSSPVAMPESHDPAHAQAHPDWLDAEPDLRRPLRFVWQTDVRGRFVHLSRELAMAVGPANAMIMGKTWPEAAAAYGILEAQGIADGFRSSDTWTAPPALWPVQGSDLGVPVEMAGVPVREDNQPAGFKGYGIARIERAVANPGSASAALSSDIQPATETPEDRFGPSVLNALGKSPDPAAHAKQTAAQNKIGSALEKGSSESDRPHQETIPDTPLATPLPVLPPVVENTPVTSPLSPTERDAFREIAKALAAMSPGAAAQENNAVKDPAALGKRETEGKAASETGKAQTPLDILRQDLIERTGLSFSAPRPDPSEKPPAPIIPYDALQSRREQKLRQDPLQNAAAAIIERVPVGLLVMQDGEAVFANRTLLDMMGFADFESFKTEGGADKLFQRRRNGRDGDVRHFTISTRQDESIQVEAAVQAITWDEAPATLTSFRRISEIAGNAQQKAAELELLAAQAELRELNSVLDTATDGVIILDGNGRILSLNRSAEALFGFDQNEIAGESLTILLEPESHIAALDYLEGLKSNGVNSIMNDGRDVKGRERNGGMIPLFMTVGRVGDRKNSLKFCAVLRDITHWKKVESDLIDAKRAAEDSSAHKTDFLAKISHEIRTPLNAIIGFSQVMMSESFGALGNDRYREYARDIHASGQHVVSLVNDLLDLSKVASGKLELNFSSVDINTLVAACVSMIQPQANAGRVIVRSQLSTNVPPVVADDRSLRQIMINLLSNAAKFTDPGGQVVASTSLTDQGEVVIRVRDTGIGMAEDEIRQAMEPFRQIPGPRATGGTGLGLPLTKALVDANRAAFAIHSEPSKGTLVEVTFPSTRVLAE